MARAPDHDLTAAQQVLRDGLYAHERLARVRLEAIWSCFFAARPKMHESVAARRLLREDLEALELAGWVHLPARGSWQRNADPPLPEFVVLAARRPPQAVHRRSGGTVGWRDELAWAAHESFSPRVLDDLRAVNTFLANGAATRAVVPARERSLELFGDEKRLASLADNSRLFSPGRLSYELLRCERTAPPFHWVRTPGPPERALVIENYDTYTSLAAAPQLPVGILVYGAGNHFTASVRRFAEMNPPPNSIHYFGDLDLAGLEIPVRASVVATDEGLPAILPSRGLYRLLLERGRAVPAGRSSPIPERIRDACRWLVDPELIERAVEILAAGWRVAQEAIGREFIEANAERLRSALESNDRTTYPN